MLAATLVVILSLGFAHANQKSTLSQEEIKRYFSVENEADAPKYAIVSVEHVNSKNSFRHVTAETIAEATPEFKFQIDDEEIHLTLKQDDSFLAPDMKAFIVFTDDGEYLEPIQRDCLYRGYVTKYGSRKSSAQISTCSGMMGAIYRDDDGPLFIEPMTDEDASKRDIGRGLAHVVYRPREGQNEQQFCAALDIPVPPAEADKTYPTVQPKDDDFYPRNTRAAKHLDMAVYADKALYDLRGSKTKTAIVAVMNSVTYLISQLGDLTASVVGTFIVHGTGSKGIIVPSADGPVYLDRAIAWANSKSGKYKVGRWDVFAVLTGLDIHNKKNYKNLGVAYVGGACNSNRRGSVSEMRDLTVVNVQTHETGHNLGCEHDGNGNTCPASGYIMNAFLSCIDCTLEWSKCSKKYYEKKKSSFTCM